MDWQSPELMQCVVAELTTKESRAVVPLRYSSNEGLGLSYLTERRRTKSDSRPWNLLSLAAAGSMELCRETCQILLGDCSWECSKGLFLFLTRPAPVLLCTTLACPQTR